MGQVLRRARGAVRLGRPDPPPPPTHGEVRPPVVDPHVPPPTASSSSGRQDWHGVHDKEVTGTANADSSLLEERDPKYDEMLRHMVGRISSRSAGKQVMGEARIVDRYRLPKLRSSREGPGTDGKKPLPPGTISVEHVRQIILLYQGKAEDHTGPMDIQDIAKKFGVDAAIVQQIVQFISVPPEVKTKNHGIEL